MPGWKSLLALCCSTLLLTAASAPRASAAAGDPDFSGAYNGTPVITLTPAVVVSRVSGGGLVVSNIGSSGQDGVSFSCAGARGLTIAHSGYLLDANDAPIDRIDFHYAWSPSSMPPSSRSSSSSIVYVAGGMDLSCDLASSGGTTSSLQLHLERLGRPAINTALNSGAFVRVSCPSGQCASPSVSFDLSHGVQRCAWSFDSPVTVTFDGQDYDCDRVVVSQGGVETGASLDGATCTARAPSSGGGGSGGALFFDALVVHSNDTWMSSSDNAVISHSKGGACPSFMPDHAGDYQFSLSVTDQTGRRAPTCSNGQCSSDQRAMLHFAAPSLVLSPLEQGSSLTTTAYGSSSVTSGGVLGTCLLTITGSNFGMRCAFPGVQSDAESVVVFHQGLEVARLPVSHGSTVSILPPTGQPLGVAINQKGLPGEKGTKPVKKAPNVAGVAARMAASSSGCPGDVLPFECGFVSDRVFSVDGQLVTGDDIVWFSSSSSSSSSGTPGACVVVSSQTEDFSLSSSSNPSVTCSSISSSSSDVVQAEVGPSSYLSSSSSCVSVPVVLHRSDATPVRAFSVTLHLSPRLASCAAAGTTAVSVREGSYLSDVSDTQFFVLDNGGGSFTVDCTQLGATCGSSGDGTLFSLDLGAAAPVTASDASIVIDDVQLRDCSNLDVPGSPGADAYVPMQFTSPPALSSLVLSKLSSGNGASGVARLSLSASCSSGTCASPSSSLSVFAHGYGGYPLYGRSPQPTGVPSPPADRADALSRGWIEIESSSLSLPFSLSSRDYYYVVVQVRDQYGNPSAMSSLSNGCPNYHYGDVTDGFSVCSGDNHVSSADISALGSLYGQSLQITSPFACLDAGPTSDRSVTGLPKPDGRLQFEDLVLYSLLYDVVSAPQAASHPLVRAAANTARLDVPALPAVGGTFDVAVNAEGTGEAQAVRITLDYDHSKLEQVAVAPGALLAQQVRQPVALSSEPGDVDVALLGAGSGIAGSGELARVTFRVKAAGDPQLAIRDIEGRDGMNQPLAFAAAGSSAPAVTRTGLAFAFPDPFRDRTDVHFALREAGDVQLTIHDIAGRRVRTLLQGTLAAGPHTLAWDGRDDAGVRMAPGAYVVRFTSAGQRSSRLIRLVR